MSTQGFDTIYEILATYEAAHAGWVTDCLPDHDPVKAEVFARYNTARDALLDYIDQLRDPQEHHIQPETPEAVERVEDARRDAFFAGSAWGRKMSAEDDGVRRMVETALPFARARAELLEQVRAALESGDNEAALLLMRRYCGLDTQNKES